jgi:hypothetical protein
MHWPERDWKRPPLELLEPWWAPHCPSEEPKAEPAPSVDKEWGGLYVDSTFKDEWLERMNSIPGISVIYTDAGHGFGELLYPAIAFNMDPRTPLAQSVPPHGPTQQEVEDHKAAGQQVREYLSRLFGDIAEVDPEPTRGHIAYRLVAWLPRIWMTECQFDAWWEEVLGRLEGLAVAGWRRVDY